MSPAVFVPGGLRLALTFHEAFFLLEVRCQSRLEDCVYVKAFNFPVQFLLKSKKKNKKKI